MQEKKYYFQDYIYLEYKEKCCHSNFSEAVLSYLESIEYTFDANLELCYLANELIGNADINEIIVKIKKFVPRIFKSPDIKEIMFSKLATKHNPTEKLQNLLTNTKFKKGNIDKLFDTIYFVNEKDKERLRSIFRKFLIGSVATFFREDTDRFNINQLMLIICGEKGIGKSSFIECLNLHNTHNNFISLQKRTFDDLKRDVREIQKSLATNFFVYFNEIDSKQFTNSTITTIKELTGSYTFSYSEKYDKNNTTFKRIGSLIGITNHKDLFDTSIDTNRKVFVIEMKGYDFKAYNKIDKIELFAECYHEFKNNKFEVNINEFEINVLSELLQRYKYVGNGNDLTEQLILDKIKPTKELPNDKNPDIRYMTATEIRELFEDTKITPVALGKALSNMEFVRKKDFSIPERKDENGKIITKARKYSTAYIVELVNPEL